MLGCWHVKTLTTVQTDCKDVEINSDRESPETVEDDESLKADHDNDDPDIHVQDKTEIEGNDNGVYEEIEEATV